jgi:HK97 family phage major capsid protein
MRALAANPNLAAQAAVQDRAAEFCILFKGQILSRGDPAQLLPIIEKHYPRSKLPAVMRAAVDAGRTDGSTWGSQLAELRQAGNAFLELVRARSVVGRLSGFRKVPFRTQFPRQLSASSVAWADEGSPTMVSAPTLDQITFEASKIAGVVVVTEELVRSSEPNAQTLVDNDLIAAVAKFTDVAFLDPTIAAVGDAPASITNGATSVSATGTTAAALKEDLRSLIDAALGGGSDLEGATLVMSKRQALAIAQFEYGRDLGANGGQLLGLPVVTSISEALAEGGSPPTERIVLLDPSLILLADDGVETAVSRQGTLQMNTEPDSPDTGATIVVNLWTRNLVAAKVERYIRWERARNGAAVFISGAAYSE